MGIVVPSAQFRSLYTFAKPAWPYTWLTIVAPAGEAATLDGTVVDPATFAVIPGTPFSVARISLNAMVAMHRLSASVPIGAYVYGSGEGTSYLFPAGMGLAR